MSARAVLIAGAAAALLAVAAGAFGAHGLEGRVSEESLATFETAVRYQLWHALAVVALAPVLARWPHPLWSAAAGLFLAGIVVFSRSLYALVLGGIGWLGAVTPVGGLSFLAGWGCVMVAAWRAVS